MMEEMSGHEFISSLQHSISCSFYLVLIFWNILPCSSEGEFLVKKVMRLEGVWYEVDCKVTFQNMRTRQKEHEILCWRLLYHWLVCEKKCVGEEKTFIIIHYILALLRMFFFNVDLSKCEVIFLITIYDLNFYF